MKERNIPRVEAYAEECRAEQAELLRTLGKLPAPTRSEDLRAAFCRDWLTSQGAENVYIDEAKNVICALGCEEGRDIIVFAAHTDIVFPDKETLPMREEGDRLYAPGIGDDTANLVNLMLAARYLIQNKVELACGVLIVANSCEEGLGNLDGIRTLFAPMAIVSGAFIPLTATCLPAAMEQWVLSATALPAVPQGGTPMGILAVPMRFICSAGWWRISTK